MRYGLPEVNGVRVERGIDYVFITMFSSCFHYHGTQAAAEIVRSESERTPHVNAPISADRWAVTLVNAALT